MALVRTPVTVSVLRTVSQGALLDSGCSLLANFPSLANTRAENIYSDEMMRLALPWVF